MGARRLAVTAAWLPWHVWMCIWHAGKKRPGAGIVQGAKLELFSAILEHACRPIMATPSHRAICLSSHSEGTTPPGSIGHAAVCCTVHPLPRWDAKPGTSSMNNQRIAHLLVQGASARVFWGKFNMHIRVENLHGREQGPMCARRTATPITHITLARDLGTELTYLLLPSCRQVRNLEQIAAAAAQRGSQDFTLSPVSRQILRRACEVLLASHSEASEHGKSLSNLTHPFTCPRRRYLGSGEHLN